MKGSYELERAGHLGHENLASTIKNSGVSEVHTAGDHLGSTLLGYCCVKAGSLGTEGQNSF